MRYTWNDKETVEAYVSFNAKQDRYHAVNKVLVEQADLTNTDLTNTDITNADNVLDLASGTGGTSQFILEHIKPSCKLSCVEPSPAMQSYAQSIIKDSRIQWLDSLPQHLQTENLYDRIICAAAIWQILPLNETFKTLASLLKPKGILCFNIPSLYLGEEDRTGEGDDPQLEQMSEWLSQKSQEMGVGSAMLEPSQNSSEEAMTVSKIDNLLSELGFTFKHYSYDYKLTQAAYRDWLKIPVISNGLLPSMDDEERRELIDEAFSHVDSTSYRWERWITWRIWKD